MRGGAGDSFKVNLETGRWADFASDEKGGDLISLYATIEGVKQGEAAKRLATDLNYRLTPGTYAPPANGVKKEPKIIPAPEGAIVPKMMHPRFGNPTATWCYKSEAGVPMFYVARYEAEDGKTFLPWSWSDEGRWVQKGFPAPRPLYGLDLLRQRMQKPVLLVEGEKAAEAARVIAQDRYVVVTWPNGAKAADKADWGPLKDRNVLLWPDADEPGKAACIKIAESLSGLAASVKIIDVSDHTDGWDAADALNDGWTWEAFFSWAKPRASVPNIQVNVQANLNINVNGDADVASKPALVTWSDLGLALSQQGNPICNMDNVLRIMERHTDFASSTWYDEFHGKYFTDWGTKGTVREWQDVDTLNMQAWIQREIGVGRVSSEMCFSAMAVYAHQRTRNEPRDWMKSLTWDNTPRVETFFKDCFGVEDSDYSRAVSKNFWVGMAARVFRPGCKLDNMVVLEGAQGTFKSTALDIIGQHWYAEAHESVTSKDFFMILKGKLIVEIAELQAFSRAEVTRIKQVITCRNDRYRAPYARVASDHPRMSIFVGTTNELHYLKDETGGRRFWPIRVGEINRDKIRDDRSQLFAEAVAMLNSGVTWYEMPKISTEQQQEARRQRDAWEDVIREYLIGKSEISIRDIGENALKIEIGKLDRLTQMRIATLLRSLGWSKFQDWNSGDQRKAWKAPDLPFYDETPDQGDRQITQPPEEAHAEPAQDLL